MRNSGSNLLLPIVLVGSAALSCGARSGLEVTASSAAGGGGTRSTGTGGGGAGGAAECMPRTFDIGSNVVDILLVLDRSASMEKDPAGGKSKPSKWEILLPALEQAITATDALVAWGLKVLPEGERAGSCSAESFPAHILVPIAPNNASVVNHAISGLTDQGDGTPTGDAIDRAVAYLKTLKDGHTKYILLATDGDPSCPSGDATSTAVKAVTSAAKAGYHTFVIGVASKASSVKNLDKLAVAGLEPRMDSDSSAPKFYLASTQADLVTALQGITGTAATCVFPLGSAPQSPNDVTVNIGGTMITRDVTNTEGWNYTGQDEMTIKLFGTACDMVKNNGVGILQVTLGCNDDAGF